MSSENKLQKVVVLGTGGTIAGQATRSSDNLGYTAAQVAVSDLVEQVAGLHDVLAGRTLHSEQVAQLDSKDMSFAVWAQLAQRVRHYLAQSEVCGVVITHGTDTLEETAFFLATVLAADLQNTKPVVLTCAMRPASALSPDGPQNLKDAVAVATTATAHGVLVVCAGVVHSALNVQKVHSYRLDAFDSGEAGPLAYVEEGHVRLVANWPLSLATYGDAAINSILSSSSSPWPRVEIVLNYAGATGAMVDALRVSGPNAAPLKGLVVAGSGNGSVHHELQAALLRAQSEGVTVWRATRCAYGRVLPVPGDALPDSQGLSPVKARVALMLALMLAPVL